MTILTHQHHTWGHSKLHIRRGVVLTSGGGPAGALPLPLEGGGGADPPLLPRLVLDRCRLPLRRRLKRNAELRQLLCLLNEI